MWYFNAIAPAPDDDMTQLTFDTYDDAVRTQLRFERRGWTCSAIFPMDD